LRFDRIGGAGDGLLSCREVRVSGHPGLIGCRPPANFCEPGPCLRQSHGRPGRSGNSDSGAR
jgi:hypothetical protein